MDDRHIVIRVMIRIASRLADASEFSAEYVLDRRLLRRQVSARPPQLGILRLELTQTLQLANAGRVESYSGSPAVRSASPRDDASVAAQLTARNWRLYLNDE